MTFESGDVVQLSSGGPLLTVAYPETDANGDRTGNYQVYFFDVSNEFHATLMDARTLRLVVADANYGNSSP